MTLKKLSRFSLLLALFLLPWQAHLILRAGELNGLWQYGTISLFAIDILILIAFLFQIITAHKDAIRFKNIPYRFGVAALIVFLCALIPASLSPSLSLAKTSTVIVSILLIYAFCKTEAPFRSTALAFISDSALSALLGVWQFASQTSFGSTILGIAEHDSTELGVSVVEALAPDGHVERWLRAYGTLDHPNMLGGLAAIALLLVAWLWISRVRNGRLENIILTVATVALTAGLIVSFSRAAWIACAVGLIIIIIGRFKTNWKQLGSFIIIIAIVGGLFASQYYYLFSPRFTADSRLEEKSSSERIVGMKESLEEIKQRPIIGSGLGTYTLSRSQTVPEQESWQYQPVHNTFLLIASEIGIAGLILTLATILAFLIFIYRRTARENRTLILAVSAGVLAIAMLDHWLWSLHFGVILSGVLFGLLSQLSTDKVLTEGKSGYTVNT